MNQRDKILVAEAKSGLQQICHIMGDDWVRRVMAEIDEATRGGN